MESLETGHQFGGPGSSQGKGGEAETQTGAVKKGRERAQHWEAFRRCHQYQLEWCQAEDMSMEGLEKESWVSSLCGRMGMPPTAIGSLGRRELEKEGQLSRGHR